MTNGIISPKTKIPLSLGIPIVVFVIGCVGWVGRVENHLAEDDKDPFRGTDMDRLSGRLQWAWQDYAQRVNLERYPCLPPWRAGTTYQPSSIKTKEDG